MMLRAFLLSNKQETDMDTHIFNIYMWKKRVYSMLCKENKITLRPRLNKHIVIKYLFLLTEWK